MLKKNFARDALDQYIVSLGGDRDPDGKYHPSSLFQCARKVIYNLRDTGKSETTEPQALRRFWIGHRLHEALQSALAVSPDVDVFYPEFEINVTSHNVTGHGDGLMRVKLEDGSWAWVIVEIKSIRKSAFKFGLKEENLKQAITYAWAVRYFGCEALSLVTGLMEPLLPLGEELAGILVIYLEKEDLAVREHFIPWSPDMQNEVLDRLTYLNQYRDDPASLPPRIPLEKGKKNWQCRFCPFQTKCWDQDPDEVKPMEAK